MLLRLRRKPERDEEKARELRVEIAHAGRVVKIPVRKTEIRDPRTARFEI